VAAADAVSMGEGGTPLLPCARAGEAAGLPRLLLKWEPANPTWSFKDRLAAVAVSWARAAGLPGVVAASSGNAGASVAAYAARAGLPCLLFTTRSFPGTMLRQMQSYGALVLATPTAPDRWTLGRAVAGAWGWLPVSNVADPPVGSHPAGIEGYKTIAFEIAEDLGWEAPDAVVVPVGYGDAIWGIWRGFRELQALGLVGRLPRMIAAETYGSLQRALAAGAESPVDTGGAGSIASSAAVPRSTYQALLAVRESGGTAIAVGDDDIRAARRTLATREGLLAELSSALPYAAAARLAAAGRLNAGERVVCLVTSSGLKDVEQGASRDIPLIDPDLPSLRRALKEHFAFDVG
jgi:threonine synthase